MTDEIGDRLFLALRTCATHPAGPLRAVADLRRAYLAGDVGIDEVSELEQTLRDRVAAMSMPDDRREVAVLFLDAVFGGWSMLARR